MRFDCNFILRYFITRMMRTWCCRGLFSEMNKVLTIYVGLMCCTSVNMQTTYYAFRFRNASVSSQSNGASMTHFRIYQDKLDHKFEARINVTKDICVKNIVADIDRCAFVNSACENFQRWTFTKNIKNIVYMKNQMWTPFFQNITPQFDFPRLKKNIYHIPDAVLDAKAILLFYPEILNPNYFWRVDVSCNDYNGKKAFIFKLECTVHAFVKKNRNWPNRVVGGDTKHVK